MPTAAKNPDEVTALLLLTAQGDEAAFRDLYDAIAGPVFGLIRRVVRDPAQSEEVAQEVMVEVWRLASRFDPERGSGKTWILTMAHRRAVDRVRSAQSSTNRDTAYGVANHEPDHDHVSSDVENEFEKRQVRNAMKELTPVQRAAVELAFYKGYTHAEVAKTLEIPLGTAKTRLRDGLIHLRDALGVT
ncbi:MAG: ECF RNA polymerase sigma factor SigK [Actinobacteria bacterium]|nr:ECF RNA polymerase sigma factor SigK [Actinomycetota bacterium]